MNLPHLSPAQISFVVLMEVEKRLSSGSDFVICRLPGGGRLMVLKNGDYACDEEQIILLLSKHMSGDVANELFESHCRECRDVGLTAFVVTGYEFLSSNDPSPN
jgi:hypothetical protein